MTSRPGFKIYFTWPFQSCCPPDHCSRNTGPKGGTGIEGSFCSFRPGPYSVCEGLHQKCLLTSIPSVFLWITETHPTGNRNPPPMGQEPRPCAKSRCGWLEDSLGLTIIIHMCTYLSSLPSTFPCVLSFISHSASPTINL